MIVEKEGTLPVKVLPKQRIVKRAGFTTNKGVGCGKKARKQAKLSRRMNRK